MRKTELRLRALARELEECRGALRAAVDRFEAERRTERARRRRLLVGLGLTLLFAAGMATSDTPSFGAPSSGAAAATDPCGPGKAAVGNASFKYVGTTVTATFTVLPACSGTRVTLASYEMLGGPSQLFPQTLYDSATAVLDAGVHQFTIQLPNCYWQDDLATGPPLPAIAPDSLYGTRLVIADKGGKTACPPPGTTSTTTTATTTTATTTTATTTTATTTTATTTTATTTTATTTTATIPTTTTGTTTVPTTGTTTTTPTTVTTPTTATTTTTPSTTATTTTTPPPGTFTPPPPPPPSATDVAVTKVADKTNAGVGEQITYLLTVVNNGPIDAADVVLVDPLPSQESLVSVSDTACTGSTVITCNFGTMAVGASRSVTVVTLARSPGVATNIATVTTTTPETNTANNQARASVPISGPLVPPSPGPKCATVVLTHSTLVAGRRATIVVHARRNGAPVGDVRVEVTGPGVHLTGTTGSSGSVSFTLTPARAGVLNVRLLQAPSCPAALTEAGIPGAFKPPRLTG